MADCGVTYAKVTCLEDAWFKHGQARYSWTVIALRSPLTALSENYSPDSRRKVQKWLKLTAFKEADTRFQVSPYACSMWVRLSGQIYLGLEDFELAGGKLKELRERLNANPGFIT
jgi:hypothetical protein